MKALGQLSPVSFLQDSRIQELYNILTPSLFVGGCVRDSLLGLQDVYDIDIATPHLPEKVIELLSSKGLKPILTGIKHGTVTLLLPPFNIEITTLRKDLETDGRHAIVEFSDNWLEDAKRRDFTINALYADINGVVFDCLGGKSFEDLSMHKVRFIGFAEDRIKEDYLRILRYFRFYSRLGGTPDKDAIISCKKHSGLLKSLAVERIAKEFQKILLSPCPENTINLMISCDILSQFTLASLDIDYLRQLVWLETRGIRFDMVYSNYYRRLIALFGGNEQELYSFANYLKLSNKDKRALKQIFLAMNTLDSQERQYRYGKEIALSSILLDWACARATNGQINSSISSKWYDKVSLCITSEIPKLPITGKDLLDLGLSPSIEIKDTLGKAEQIFINSNYSLNKSQLLQDLGL